MKNHFGTCAASSWSAGGEGRDAGLRLAGTLSWKYREEEDDGDEEKEEDHRFRPDQLQSQVRNSSSLDHNTAGREKDGKGNREREGGERVKQGKETNKTSCWTAGRKEEEGRETRSRPGKSTGSMQVDSQARLSWRCGERTSEGPASSMLALGGALALSETGKRSCRKSISTWKVHGTTRHLATDRRYWRSRVG